MSAFETIRFTSGFEVPEDQEYAGRPSFLRGVADAYKPGLFKVVFSIQDRRTRSLTPLDTLFFELVQDEEDEPDFSEEEFAKILLARIYDHNQDVRQETRYVMRVSYRGKGKGTKAIYETLLVDDEDGPRSAPPRTPVEFFEADEGSPGAMFMQHLGQMLGEMRNFQVEMRHDVTNARQHANVVMDKLIEVVGNHVQHSNNQATAAAAGWDALHTGIDMQKKHHAEVAELRATVQAQSYQLELMQQTTKKEKRNELMGSMLPAGLLAAGKTLTDRGSALGPLLTGLAAMAGGGPSAPTSTPKADEGPPTNGAPPNGASTRTVDAIVIDEVDVNLEELCTAEEISSAPLVCVARTLGRSLGPSQRQSLHQILTPEEWKFLNAALEAHDTSSITQSMMGFFISFQNRDTEGTLLKKLTMRLSLFQRNLVKSISDYVTGSTAPLDVPNMKTSAWKKPKTPAPPPASAPPPTPPEPPPSTELDDIKETLRSAAAALAESRKIQEAQAQKIAELEQKLTPSKPSTRKKTSKKTPKN